jgi:hypothetical protein
MEFVQEFERSKRHAADLYSRDSESVIGSAYDIYERGISDFESKRHAQV